MVGFDFSVEFVVPVDSRRHTQLAQTISESEQFAATIEQAVWHATAAAVKDLQVELCNGELTLTGRCRTYYIKQVAQQAAMAAAPDWRVLNEIEVT